MPWHGGGARDCVRRLSSMTSGGQNAFASADESQYALIENTGRVSTIRVRIGSGWMKKAGFRGDAGGSAGRA